MDGLIVIRSITLSNHIAEAPQPVGVLVSYHRALGERGRDNSINEGYKEPAMVEGIWGSSANTLASREH